MRSLIMLWPMVLQKRANTHTLQHLQAHVEKLEEVTKSSNMLKFRSEVPVTLFMTT